MTFGLRPIGLLGIVAVFGLSACGGGGGGFLAGGSGAPEPQVEEERSTIWDLFKPQNAPDEIGAVNKYIWNASLEVLSFLPIQSIDPFSGVIVMGYGTPPGGGRAYRATVLIDDPALEARSLKLVLMTRSGPASADTVRAVEDAILTRARQLRKADSRF